MQNMELPGHITYVQFTVHLLEQLGIAKWQGGAGPTAWVINSYRVGDQISHNNSILRTWCTIPLFYIV
jgi:hypothetical protein